MRPPSLNLEDPAAKRQELLSLVEQTPGATLGVKVAALLLLLEGQRPGWIVEVLGLTRMSLNRWIHSVNEQGVNSLVPLPKPGRPAALQAARQAPAAVRSKAGRAVSPHRCTAVRRTAP